MENGLISENKCTPGISVKTSEMLKNKLMEYVFYTNVGDKMSDVMLAIRHSTQ